MLNFITANYAVDLITVAVIVSNNLLINLITVDCY